MSIKLLTSLLALIIWTDFVAMTSAACPQYCINCSLKSTLCNTDETEPFPLTLDSLTRKLVVNYKGNKVFSLTYSMIARYQSLRDLTITGNTAGIGDNTFKSSCLERLTIHHSKLNLLPDTTFGNHSSLDILSLDHNSFMSQIPTNVFHSLKNLTQLDLSYNSIPLCERENIGEEFELLTSLQTLSLAGSGQQNPQKCSHLTEHFFKQLSRVQNLNLSETAFFHGSQTILLPLTNMVNLYIFNVAPYNVCPAKVKHLFGNLRSEEHTSELQSHVRISYAVFCLKKKKKKQPKPSCQ